MYIKHVKPMKRAHNKKEVPMKQNQKRNRLRLRGKVCPQKEH